MVVGHSIQHKSTNKQQESDEKARVIEIVSAVFSRADKLGINIGEE